MFGSCILFHIISDVLVIQEEISCLLHRSQSEGVQKEHILNAFWEWHYCVLEHWQVGKVHVVSVGGWLELLVVQVLVKVGSNLGCDGHVNTREQSVKDALLETHVLNVASMEAILSIDGHPDFGSLLSIVSSVCLWIEKQVDVGVVRILTLWEPRVFLVVHPFARFHFLAQKRVDTVLFCDLPRERNVVGITFAHRASPF
mmetsp:Transcript_11332/g.42476  ORF Transcript_11332/g.42476 Transcript_11332/m.42476 type:complete len:200 (+) Transcript_11332:636-1235(+)